MNCPISVVDVGSTRVAQAHNSSIWRGDSRPVPPFRSNRTSASMPPSWNSLIQMRMVESSTKRTLATSSKLIPRSSSRMAFARRETRFSSSPSLVIATRSARSAALRKLRLVFTRRLESIPLIRSNDFRKNEESRYTAQFQPFVLEARGDHLLGHQAGQRGPCRGHDRRSTQDEDNFAQGRQEPEIPEAHARFRHR